MALWCGAALAALFSVQASAFSLQAGSAALPSISRAASCCTPSHLASGSSVGRPLVGILGLRAQAEGLSVYNTLAREKQPFKTLEEGKVKMYTCGPTVYDFAHIGNFRAFLTYDLIKRWLLYLGYDVEHVCNLTDVDDKIIQRMQRDKVGLKELTDKYAEAFMSDLAKLNILPAGSYPRATQHIDDIVEMVQGLADKGHAYENKGSFYFDVESFKEYGKLARLDFDNMRDGAGEGGGITDPEAFEKKGARDFALWKAYKPEDGEVFWETPLGKGRPGWHIECSAMCKRFLGKSIDIHAGGVDLTFPHHENEIAQSECYCGCEMSRYWMHNGFVNINNEKMSKSLGNFLTIRDVLKTADDCRAFRYLVVSSQYRQSLNFAPEVLKGAQSTLKRLDKWKAKLETAEKGGKGAGGGGKELYNTCLQDFEVAMNDDLNTPRACAALFTFVKSTEKMLNEGSMSSKDASLCLEALSKMDKVLGVYFDVPVEDEKKAGISVTASDEDLALLDERNKAKADKNWARADEIRDLLKEKGFVIKDVKGGASELVPL